MRAIRSQIKDERFYAVKNEPVKRGKSKMQERRDRENNTVGMQWECNENALRKCNIHLTGVLEK